MPFFRCSCGNPWFLFHVLVALEESELVVRPFQRSPFPTSPGVLYRCPVCSRYYMSQNGEIRYLTPSALRTYLEQTSPEEVFE